MSVTLIYGNCKAKAAGDFTAAAEVAYRLQNYFYETGENSQCILASSGEGVKKFESLYGSHDGLAHLEIHGVPFEVVNINEFVNDSRVKEVKNFLEVAFCEPPPASAVAKIVDPLSTKVLVVGLPHYPMNNCDMFLKQCFPQSCANGLAHTVATGFGKDRIGIPVYQALFEPLKHKDYCGITQKPYGFAYFKGGFQEHATSTMIDYLRVATSLGTPYKNFVLVGDCKLNLEAIKGFLMFCDDQQTIEVVDQSTKTIYTLSPLRANVKEKPLPQDYEVDALSNNTIHICLLDHVSTDQMRSLLKSAQPFFCSEGINTPIEGMAFGKIPFIQFMLNNEELYPMYHKAVLAACPADLKHKMEQLLALCLRHERMRKVDRIDLELLLDDQKLIDAYIKINLDLVNNAPDPAQSIADELHREGKIDPSYQGKAFGETSTDILESPFLQVLLSLLAKESSRNSEINKNSQQSVDSQKSDKPSPLAQNCMFNLSKNRALFKPTFPSLMSLLAEDSPRNSEVIKNSQKSVDSQKSDKPSLLVQNCMYHLPKPSAPFEPTFSSFLMNKPTPLLYPQLKRRV